MNNASYLLGYLASTLAIILLRRPLKWLNIGFLNRLCDGLVWNSLIVFFLEAGLDISVCTMIELGTLKERVWKFGYGNWISLGLSCALLLCFLGVACLNRCYLRRHYD
jgi:hypothetical protein